MFEERLNTSRRYLESILSYGLFNGKNVSAMPKKVDVDIIGN